MRDRGAAEIRKRYLTGRQPQIVTRVSPHYGRLSGVLCGHGDVMLWEDLSYERTISLINIAAQGN